MKKDYEINKDNIINDVKDFINSVQEDINSECDSKYNICYKNGKNAKRKINITIEKRINFDNKEFFNEYSIRLRTYIKNKKIDDDYIKYMIYDDESNGKHKNIRNWRLYNLNYLYDRIYEFIEYQQER